jgi:hypothetical protein
MFSELDRDGVAPVTAVPRFDCHEGYMRKLILMIAVLAACSKTETAKTDTAAPAMAPPPAAMTAADISGTWNGTTMAEQSDSVLNRFTVVSADGMTGKFIIEGQKDSVSFTTVLDADSLVATSAPYTDPNMKGAKVMFRSVGRMKDGKLVGTSTIMPASKPDSVAMRARWEATKAP